MRISTWWIVPVASADEVREELRKALANQSIVVMTEREAGDDGHEFQFGWSLPGDGEAPFDEAMRKLRGDTERHRREAIGQLTEAVFTVMTWRGVELDFPQWPRDRRR